MLEAYSTNILWIVILGFVIAFVLAFGIGANDVANSFGTSVGSGVLSIRAACWLATICEVSGAILIGNLKKERKENFLEKKIFYIIIHILQYYLTIGFFPFKGYKVSDTMRKGILEINLYNDSETELMLGFISALASSALWLLVATFLKLPISGTHSIVGSTIGFSLVARGTNGIQWLTLGKIIGSWFISPVMSGIMSVFLFWCIRTLILKANNPLNAGLIALPLIYGLTTFINVLSIVLDGPKCKPISKSLSTENFLIMCVFFLFSVLYMDNITAPIAIAISSGIGLFIAIAIQIFLVPWQRQEITGKTDGGRVKFSINDSSESTPCGSPKRNRRPISLVQNDSKILPAITEQTELASFNNLSSLSPCFYANEKMNADQKNHAQTNGSYKIDAKIVEKAEHLLGKNRSLDNIDLTITSLNFIDEHHQQPNGHGLSTGIQSQPLQSYFDNQLNHQLSSNSRQR